MLRGFYARSPGEFIEYEEVLSRGNKGPAREESLFHGCHEELLNGVVIGGFTADAVNIRDHGHGCLYGAGVPDKVSGGWISSSAEGGQSGSHFVAYLIGGGFVAGNLVGDGAHAVEPEGGFTGVPHGESTKVGHFVGNEVVIYRSTVLGNAGRIPTGGADGVKQEHVHYIVVRIGREEGFLGGFCIVIKAHGDEGFHILIAEGGLDGTGHSEEDEPVVGESELLEGAANHVGTLDGVFVKQASLTVSPFVGKEVSAYHNAGAGAGSTAGIMGEVVSTGDASG